METGNIFSFVFGFQISRSASYLRLLPRKSNSDEGKRHVQTVPVRLRRATNDSHRSHVDSKFCQATINYMEEIASLLGTKQVLFVSQDDKVCDQCSCILNWNPDVSKIFKRGLACFVSGTRANRHYCSE